MEDALVRAIAQAERSVVAIAKVRREESLVDPMELAGRIRFPQGLFARQLEPTDPGFIPNEFGTGVVVGAKGLILTTYHVLGDVKTSDYYLWIGRRPFRGRVIAADPWLDLAVLEAVSSGTATRERSGEPDGAPGGESGTNPTADFVPIEFGDARGLRRGQFVIALGNPQAIARDGTPSASWGIVANLHRAPPRPEPVVGAGTPSSDRRETFHHFGTMIQTDARLTFGTSGGALLNLQGQMVGLTVALTALSGLESAAGFAFPVDEEFRQAVQQLKQGKVPAYGFLGIAPTALSADERRAGRFGVVISEVIPSTPAAEAGLRHRDLITHVNGAPIFDAESLIRQVGGRLIGNKVELTVERPNVLGKAKPFSLEVGLVKRYLPTSRPPIATVTDPPWRGMTVEYFTAVPQFTQMNALIGGQPCVAVADVQPDSPAWKAGFRPGDFITHVGRSRVASPEQFRALVGSTTDEVTLRLLSTESSPVTRIVGP